MERTDKLTRFTSLVLFAALLAYVGFYVLRSIINPVVTTLAVATTVTETTTVSGIVVRDETFITSGAENVSVTAADGKHVSEGAELAVALGSEAALERANRQKELELEIARAKAILQGGDVQDATQRDNTVRSSVLGLASAVAAHKMQDIESYGLSLGSLVLSEGADTVTQADLDALEQELSGMETARSPGATRVLAPASGTFTTALDGYEYLTLESVSGITAEQLRELMQNRQEVPEQTLGKLITSYLWYYAATVEESAAGGLEEGDTLYLDFGRYYGKPIAAKVLEKGKLTEGEQVILFSCGAGLEETVQMRTVSAEIVMNTYTGIRVPAEAIHREEEETFVYTMTARQAEKKPVTILYENEEFCVVEKSPDSAGLREGNEVIVKAKGLYDGKVMD